MLNYPAFKNRKGDYTTLFKKLTNKKSHFNDLFQSRKIEQAGKMKAGERVGGERLSGDITRKYFGEFSNYKTKTHFITAIHLGPRLRNGSLPIMCVLWYLKPDDTFRVLRNPDFPG